MASDTRQARWNKRNPGVVKQSKKAWIARNKARHREYNWRAHHNVKAMWRRARLRAKDRGTPFNITLADVAIPSRCPVLGLRLFNRKGTQGGCDNAPTIDEIIPGCGYVKGNVAVICWRANRLKSDATLEELRSILRYYAKSSGKAR